MKITIGMAWLLLMTTTIVAQQPAAPGDFSDVIAQPATWVPFHADVERNGVQVGRFWRDRNGSTRLQLDVPDAAGRAIMIENVPEARYYVYRPATGWTVQPMLLPTQGWRPQPMPRLDAGIAVLEDGLSAYERVRLRQRERHVPALNFFVVRRESLDDGSVERYRRILVADPPAGAFAPPANATVTALEQPGGIIARPAPRGGGQ